jgi:hypothetical protein
MLGEELLNHANPSCSPHYLRLHLLYIWCLNGIHNYVSMNKNMKIAAFLHMVAVGRMERFS